MSSMNNDEKIKEFCNKAFCEIHASEELSEKIKKVKDQEMDNMSANTTRKNHKIIKIVSAVAAAAALITAGGAIVSASKSYKGEYETVVINGIETKARYGKVNNGVYFIEAVKDHIDYSVWIYGSYDVVNDTLYITDNGDYAFSSTVTEPTLNLYEGIKNTPYGELVDSTDTPFIKKYPNGDSETAGNEYNASFITDYLPSEDIKDGTADGVAVAHVWDNDDLRYAPDASKYYNIGEDGKIVDYTVMTVLPNGSLVSTSRSYTPGNNEADDLLWGTIWGEEDPSALVEYASEQDKKIW